MADYRLYFHDRNGHIQAAEEFVCLDDAEALGISEDLLKGAPGELWQLARRVRKFEAAKQARRF